MIAEADRPTDRQEADERVDRIREHFQPSDYLLLVRLALFLEKWTVDMNELIEYTNTFNLPTIHYTLVYGELRPLQRHGQRLQKIDDDFAFVYGELRPLHRRMPSSAGATSTSSVDFVPRFVVRHARLRRACPLQRRIRRAACLRPLQRLAVVGRRHLFVPHVTTLVRVREKTKGGQYTYAHAHALRRLSRKTRRRTFPHALRDSAQVGRYVSRPSRFVKGRPAQVGRFRTRTR